MNFKDKNILILGYGKSGQSASELLSDFAKNIFIYDKNFKVNILNKENNCFFNKNNYFCDNLFKILKNKIHFAIISPGFDVNSKEVKLIKSHCIKILSELELGAYFCKGKILAVTGSNGKTTTVNMIYDIFKNAKKSTFLCGNVGTPITSIAKKTTQNSIIICEVSSFQMETTNYYFKPFASCILNLEPDHLDRHKTQNNYFYLKNKINKYYKTKKYFGNNKNCKIIVKNVFFNCFLLKNNKKLINFINNIKFLNIFNLENILCAIYFSKLFNIKNKIIKESLEKFKGLSHRLEVVKIHDQITYLNDSKSTNVASTISALKKLGNNIILLVGGSDKNLNFSPIFKCKKIKQIIAFGESRNNIARDGKNKKILTYEKFVDAVKKSFELAKANDTVLLSPACASFDEFKNYEKRGELFCHLVNEFTSHTLEN